MCCVYLFILRERSEDLFYYLLSGAFVRWRVEKGTARRRRRRMTMLFLRNRPEDQAEQVMKWAVQLLLSGDEERPADWIEPTQATEEEGEEEEKKEKKRVNELNSNWLNWFCSSDNCRVTTG